MVTACRIWKKTSTWIPFGILPIVKDPRENRACKEFKATLDLLALLDHKVRLVLLELKVIPDLPDSRV
jgi:hypothetical protein